MTRHIKATRPGHGGTRGRAAGVGAYPRNKEGWAIPQPPVEAGSPLERFAQGWRRQAQVRHRLNWRAIRREAGLEGGIYLPFLASPPRLLADFSLVSDVLCRAFGAFAFRGFALIAFDAFALVGGDVL